MFIETGTKIKQLLHDLQSGKDYTTLREQLAHFIDHKQNQINFEVLYIETKRELEKQALEMSHLKHKVE